MNKRVFMSGGNGVIGNALVENLHRRGACIMVGDLKPRPLGWPASIRYRQGDLNHITGPELAAFAPQVFIHLAATFERSTETYEFWHENDQHNARLSHHLITLLKDSVDLESVLFASSYLVYDPALYLFPEPQATAVRLHEDGPIRARNLCGAAKLYHEAELAFIKEFRPHIRVCMPRIFRSYGFHSRDVISRWVRSLLRGEALEVYQLEGLFDYVFADDVAEGIVRLIEAGAEGPVNLATDKARRVADVVAVLRSHFPEMQTTSLPSVLPFEASQAAMDRMWTHTGWIPTTEIDDAIPRLIAAEREHGSLDDCGPPIHVLVTSASAEVPQLTAVRRALEKVGGGGRLFGADANADVLSRHFVDEFWHMPPLAALPVERIIEYCAKRGILALIPTRDGELGYFAQHRETLRQAGIHTMVSSVGMVSTCVDKLEFSQWCTEAGFPSVPTRQSLDGVDSARVVAKERFGAGSRNVGLNLSRDEAARYAQRLECPVFQPYVAGREISIDAYVSRSGMLKGCILRSRDLVVGGESKVTTLVRIPELESLARSLLERMECYGHVMLQALVDDAGRFHVLECNARFGGASSLSIAAGLDSFYWFLLEAGGQDIDEYQVAAPQGTLRQVRYEADLLV